MRQARLIFALLVAAGGAASGQTPTGMANAFRPTDAQILFMLQNLPVENAKTLGPIINALLSDTTSHMKMAPTRTATHEDTVRANDVVKSMRASLKQYADVAVAEKAGYVRFLPWLEAQDVYHFNHNGNARTAATETDPTKPTSLLYRKNEKGAMVLVGAMYTAPATATLDELDARLPRGVAYWHQHVNFCALRPTNADRAAMRADSTLIARALSIQNNEECVAQGGIFIPQLFGWMAHVNAFEGDAMDTIWGGEGKDHMHMHHHP